MNATVLQTERNKAATKRWYINAQGELAKESYSNGVYFTPTTREFNNLDELAAVLQDLETQTNKFIIRGVVNPNYASYAQIQRKKTENNGYIDPSEGHTWLPLDLDDVDSPITDAVDLDSDGNIVGINDYNAYVKSVVETHLPSYFHNVSTFWQLTSSFGVRGYDKAKLRLWYILDEPVTDAVLHNVWQKHYVKQVDQAIYRDVQPIYVSAPIFDGVTDPCNGNRSGLLRGTLETVTIDPAHLKLPVEEQERLERNSVLLKLQKNNPLNTESVLGYGYSVLRSVAKTLKSAKDDRYNGVGRFAKLLGGIAGHMNETAAASFAEDVVETLYDASVTNGATKTHGAGKVADSIRGAFSAGTAEPVVLPEELMYGETLLDVKRSADHYYEINQRYLDDKTLQRYIDKHPDAVLLLESPLGTAKTTALMSLYGTTRVNPVSGYNEPAFGTEIITPLVSLTGGLAGKFAATNYQEIDKYDCPLWGSPSHWSVQTGFRLAVCINSVYKYLNYQPQTMIIDEADAVTHRLAQKELTNPLGVKDVLVKKMRGADTVIMASAYLDKSVSELAKTTGKEVVVIRNTYQPALNTTYKVYENQAILLERGIYRAIAAGQKVAVATDSLGFAKTVAMNIPKDKRVMLLTGDNKGGDKQKAFLLDPNGEASNYDVIIYTPVLTSGTSFDAGHGFTVFGYLCALSVSPRDGMQLLHRFRGVDKLHICVDNMRQHGVVDPKRIVSNDNTAWLANVKEMQERGSDAIQLMNYPDNKTTFAFRDSEYEVVYSHAIAVDNVQRLDYRTTTIGLLEATGRVDDGAPEVDASQDEKDQLKGLRDAVKEAGYEVISTAKDIDDSVYAELDNKHDATPEEVVEMSRYRLLRYYNFEGTEDEVRNLARADDGERNKVERLSIIRSNDEAIEYRTTGELVGFNMSDARNIAVRQFHLYDLRRKFGLLVLECANIDPVTLKQTACYTIESASKALTKIIDDKDKYEKLSAGKIPTKRDLTNKKQEDFVMTWIGNQLMMLGFKVESGNGVTKLSTAQHRTLTKMIRDGTKLVKSGLSNYTLDGKKVPYKTAEWLEREHLVTEDGEPNLVVLADLGLWKDGKLLTDSNAPAATRAEYVKVGVTVETGELDRNGNPIVMVKGLLELREAAVEAKLADYTPPTVGNPAKAIKVASSGQGSKVTEMTCDLIDPTMHPAFIELLERYEAGDFSDKVRARLASILENDEPNAVGRLFAAVKYLKLDEPYMTVLAFLEHAKAKHEQGVLDSRLMRLIDDSCVKALSGDREQRDLVLSHAAKVPNLMKAYPQDGSAYAIA